MGGEEDAKRDRKREHPLPHRHPRDDVIDQAGSGLRHAPGAALGAKPVSLTGKRDQLLIGAPGAAQAQKAVRQDAGSVSTTDAERRPLAQLTISGLVLNFYSAFM